MPASFFHSFLETPIFFLTVKVRFGLPVLGDEAAHAILRTAWLRSAVRDRWFVGHSRVLPDGVSLLACPGHETRSVTAWAAGWQAAAAVRIKQVTGGHGQLWESGAPPAPVVSAAEYAARYAALLVDPVGSDHRGVFVAAGHGGRLWQLLPVDVPDSAAVVAR